MIDKSRTLIGGLLLLVCVLLASVFWLVLQLNNAVVPGTDNSVSRTHSPARNQLPPVQRDRLEGLVSNLSENIATLDVRLSENIESIEARLTALAEPGNGDDNNEATLPVAGAAQQAPRRTPAEIDALLENALYDATSVDPAWSSETTQHIQQLFESSPDLGLASTVNVTCGSALCKIETTLPDGASPMDENLFELNLFAELSSKLPRATKRVITLADGTTQSVYYLARTGHLLPTEGKQSADPEAKRGR